MTWEGRTTTKKEMRVCFFSHFCLLFFLCVFKRECPEIFAHSRQLDLWFPTAPRAAASTQRPSFDAIVSSARCVSKSDLWVFSSRCDRCISRTVARDPWTLCCLPLTFGRVLCISRAWGGNQLCIARILRQIWSPGKENWHISRCTSTRSTTRLQDKPLASRAEEIPAQGVGVCGCCWCCCYCC